MRSTSSVLRNGWDERFQPEVIMPAQWSGLHAEPSPEKRLMIAVLEDAFLTPMKNCRVDNTAAKVITRQTQAWFDSDDPTYLCSFLNIRQALSLEPDPIRRRIRELIASPQPLPQRRQQEASPRPVRPYADPADATRSDQQIFDLERYGEMSRRIRNKLELSQIGFARMFLRWGSRISATSVQHWEDGIGRPGDAAKDALRAAYAQVVLQIPTLTLVAEAASA